ncbi:MAG: glycoside hydrolase family 30 beta sandwich domain-containing protein [Methylobacter sp.]|uniref:glycoside hydrolase family 30 protein n=1 Tax=Methylobacter sp. TaxID=2051955 RepID=UPI00272FEA14|nr:glycoside hydrolase family 30 beta sandwich domain-containing protein [Methylobacter sp.]MDP1663618.1 glycoside hydrolase family 30 beta sandwich domain-containing protein [Methylobacter sp.]MDP1970831.1 glycoside hydrolase family 30 beta sandwich domain-containing protein [Methylobacter sp.]
MPEQTNPYDPILPVSEDPSSVAVWLTSADQTFLFQRQTDDLRFADNANDFPALTVDTERKYQVIEGFGFSLTGGSAMLISRLPAPDRSALLRELFLPDGDGIGISFLRLSIGASDLSERCFSYDDRPDGQPDPELIHFDIEAGDLEVTPLLREILAINPGIKIMATAWSAPTWMKTNQSFCGGKLRPDCYAVYAAYLIKYLQAMRGRGITVHAITPQNEPLNQKNEPSMIMEASEQAEFIKNHLGPALQSAGLADVELFCWDHNCDVPEYPLEIFADADARRYLTGSAWHLYGGDISALSEVHQLYPEMKLYFTEQWVGSDGQFGGDLMWHVKNVLIGSLRNWSRVVLEWNLASDPFCCPHTPGGEASCVGALTLGEEVTRNVAYYVIAHASKFVRPGSVRIYSDQQASLPNVAFLTPAGDIVLIVLNDGAEPRSFTIQFQGKNAAATLPPNAVATYVWRTA